MRAFTVPYCAFLCLWMLGLTFGRLKLKKKHQLIKPMYNQSMARGFHQPKSRPHEFGNDYQKIKPLPRPEKGNGWFAQIHLAGLLGDDTSGSKTSECDIWGLWSYWSIQKYGYWCGSGNRKEPDGTDKPPVDAFDRCCYDHDKCYDAVENRKDNAFLPKNEQTGLEVCTLGDQSKTKGSLGMWDISFEWSATENKYICTRDDGSRWKWFVPKAWVSDLGNKCYNETNPYDECVCQKCECDVDFQKCLDNEIKFRKECPANSVEGIKIPPKSPWKCDITRTDESGDTLFSFHGVYCRPYGSSGPRKCILPEEVCDGIKDCDKGWDESPEVCIGKCDFWYQHQTPNLKYNDDINGGSVIASTAKICHEACQEYEGCYKYNWRGNYTPPGASPNRSTWDENCLLLDSTSKPDLNGQKFLGKEEAVETISSDEVHYVRGVKECPKENPASKRCTPVNGIPYRDGFFLIQAYNGMFLSFNNSDAIQIEPLSYKDLTKNSHEIYKNDGDFKLNSNKGEWVFFFHGKKTLAESYFLIASSFGENDNSKPKYLTFKHGDPFDVSIQERSKSANISQKWHMEMTRIDRGYTEVKIYVKNPYNQKKLYITLPVFSETFSEYHYVLKDAASVRQDPLSVFLTEDDLYQSQIFRIFELEYLWTGKKESKARGVTRTGDRTYIEIFNDHENIVNDYFLPFVDNLGDPDKLSFPAKDMLHSFGVIPSKLSLLDHRKVTKWVQRSVIESYTLHDYAGRMKIYDERAFGSMWQSWHLRSEKDKILTAEELEVLNFSERKLEQMMRDMIHTSKFLETRNE